MTDPGELAARLAFVREAERLKDTLRSGTTAQGRAESVAEHSWRLALLVLAFADLVPGIDPLRLLKLVIIHDLGEIYEGDVPAIHQGADDGRAARERADFHRLTADLPAPLRTEFRAIYDEYAAAETPEAVLAKGFDKLETILQHTQGANAPDFDYRFNLDYGRARTDAHALLAEIRALIDAETEALAEGRASWAG
ncbi:MULTISPECIES: HD domain-containing protein [unclassified Roseitalea]|uniref:HD domain-containing protein n=1 Tax=unclassified Roseitalea TaxID=2639107 RepID=UPI00273D17CE|nr:MULTISPECIES: HD domain-containing protein [unclassified Roseitalea]